MYELKITKKISDEEINTITQHVRKMIIQEQEKICGFKIGIDNLNVRIDFINFILEEAKINTTAKTPRT